MDYIDVTFVEYDTELSRPIEYCAVYDQDEIGQWCDLSYRSALRRKQN